MSQYCHVFRHVTWRDLKNIMFITFKILCERFEPRNHFISRLSLIVRVNVDLNRTVVVDSD